MRHGITHFEEDKPWVLKNFEKELVLTIRTRAEGYIEKKELEGIRTPGELIEEFAACPALLKLEYFFWDGGAIYKQDKELYRKSRLDILYLFNYVYKIPSDYYRLRHPRFSLESGVKQATAKQELAEELADDDEEEDEK